jgi:phage shock protein PspC (stress-responsive transcriptional regulator)
MTKQPDATQPTGRAAVSGERVLRRRSDDRVIGGVASGLGDFLNVDPLLIRIGFVGLMVFGGLGLILYVGAWLLLPDETREDSIAEQLLERVGLTPSRIGSALLLLIGGLLLLGGVSSGVPLPGFASTVAAAFVIIVAGVALLRQGERHAAVTASPAAERVTRAPAAPASVAVPAAPVRRRVKRPPSPLGWYVLGAIFAAIGLLALATNLLGVDVDPGQFFGVALAALGIGLVIGTWWGRARLLILLGVLLLPFAVTASFVTAPIAGGVGDHWFEPTSPAEVRDEYRLVGGRIILDLTDLEATGEPIVISASVAIGRLVVHLPADASFEIDAGVGGGDLLVLGTRQVGSGLSDRYVQEGDGPRFVLDLETGIGAILVDGGPVGGR